MGTATETNWNLDVGEVSFVTRLSDFDMFGKSVAIAYHIRLLHPTSDLPSPILLGL